jgi:uncharacterized membrane protein YbhN (UPF0104 family)
MFRNEDALTPRQRVRTAAGYLIAAVCLVWVFHDVQIEPMLHGARELRWTWVAMAIVADVLSYATQGLRWKLLLASVGNVRWLDATQAIYAGLFASEVLPLRPGEVLRAFVISRRLQTDASAVFPSIMVERLFDGVWLAIGVGIAAALMPLPESLLRAGDVLGVLIVLATILFLYEILRVRDGHAAAMAAGTPGQVGRVERFRQRFQDIGRKRETYLAFALSFVFFAAQILAFWLVMVAYDLDVSVWVGAAALVIVHLGTAIPNAPANVGTYQFFCVVALTLFGVDKTLATGFSVIAFIILTVPLWLLGSLALGRSGATLASIRRAGGATLR